MHRAEGFRAESVSATSSNIISTLTEVTISGLLLISNELLREERKKRESKSGEYERCVCLLSVTICGLLLMLNELLSARRPRYWERGNQSSLTAVE